MVTVLLSGVPVDEALEDLAANIDEILNTDEVGTFRVRELSLNGIHRKVALDFDSGYDAMPAQELLDKYNYVSADGEVYTFIAKVTHNPAHLPKIDLKKALENQTIKSLSPPPMKKPRESIDHLEQEVIKIEWDREIKNEKRDRDRCKIKHKHSSKKPEYDVKIEDCSTSYETDRGTPSLSNRPKNKHKHSRYHSSRSPADDVKKERRSLSKMIDLEIDRESPSLSSGRKHSRRHSSRSPRDDVKRERRSLSKVLDFETDRKSPSLGHSSRRKHLKRERRSPSDMLEFEVDRKSPEGEANPRSRSKNSRKDKRRDDHRHKRHHRHRNRDHSESKYQRDRNENDEIQSDLENAETEKGEKENEILRKCVAIDIKIVKNQDVHENSNIMPDNIIIKQEKQDNNVVIKGESHDNLQTENFENVSVDVLNGVTMKQQDNYYKFVKPPHIHIKTEPRSRSPSPDSDQTVVISSKVKEEPQDLDEYDMKDIIAKYEVTNTIPTSSADVKNEPGSKCTSPDRNGNNNLNIKEEPKDQNKISNIKQEPKSRSPSPDNLNIKEEPKDQKKISNLKQEPKSRSPSPDVQINKLTFSVTADDIIKSLIGCSASSTTTVKDEPSVQSSGDDLWGLVDEVLQDLPADLIEDRDVS